jgi:hypothetical protein
MAAPYSCAGLNAGKKMVLHGLAGSKLRNEKAMKKG